MTVTLQRLLVLAGQRPVTTTGNSIWSYLLKLISVLTRSTPIILPRHCRRVAYVGHGAVIHRREADAFPFLGAVAVGIGKRHT
jgi:hypothetical protein